MALPSVGVAGRLADRVTFAVATGLIGALADLDRRERVLVDDIGRGIDRPAVQVLAGTVHQIALEFIVKSPARV